MLCRVSISKTWLYNERWDDSTIHMALSTECVCAERSSHLSNWRYYYRNCLSATITVNSPRRPYVSERELRMFVIGYYIRMKSKFHGGVFLFAHADYDYMYSKALAVIYCVCTRHDNTCIAFTPQLHIHSRRTYFEFLWNKTARRYPLCAKYGATVARHTSRSDNGFIQISRFRAI